MELISKGLHTFDLHCYRARKKSKLSKKDQNYSLPKPGLLEDFGLNR